MRTLPFLFALLLMGLRTGEVTAQPKPTEMAKSIAVADFTGNDKEYGKFIADTLLTDLARSQKLSLVERNEIRQTFQELKLQSTGLTEPKQVQKVGKLLSADGLIVGSYLQRGNTLTINARLLDVRTGRLAAGGSANVSGTPDNLLALTEKLARYLHRNLTGTALPAEVEPAEEGLPSPQTTRPAELLEPGDMLTALKAQRVAPANAQPSHLLVERDLEKLIQWAGTQFPRQENPPLMLSNPNTPVTRIRVLAALVKRGLPREHIAHHRNTPDSELTPDGDRIPLWGKPFVASAIEEQWWSQNTPLNPVNGATWGFVTKLLDRMPVDSPKDQQGNAPVRSPQAKKNRAETPDPDAYTGLVLEAQGLTVERAMGPRILDEDGKVIYPLKGEYDYDALLEHGMVSYCETVRQTNKRAGGRPLTVRVIDTVSPSNSDFIVSREDGERIQRANRRGHFLERWAVSVIASTR